MTRSRRDLTPDQASLLTTALIDLARDLRPITVRGLYYQAVISALLPFITKDHDGERSNYRLVQGRVLKLREDGSIPWEWVVDESRPSYSITRFSDPADFAGTAPFYFDLDYWEGQISRPLLMVEKAGQIPVFLDHARSFGVDVVACKGYGSASHLSKVAESINAWLQQGQSVEVIVAHDFDPSGCDWPRAAEATIREHCYVGGRLNFRRELVTPQDAAAMGEAVALRPPNPKDSRTQSWLQDHGFDADRETCVEMDAISPAVARSRMKDAYLSLFQGDIEDRRLEEQDHRETIRQALETLRP